MAFTYKLEHADGTPADQPTFRSLPGTSWTAGDVLHVGPGRELRVVGSRLAENLDGDPVPVLVVAPA